MAFLPKTIPPVPVGDVGNASNVGFVGTDDDTVLLMDWCYLQLMIAAMSVLSALMMTWRYCQIGAACN